MSGVSRDGWTDRELFRGRRVGNHTVCPVDCPGNLFRCRDCNKVHAALGHFENIDCGRIGQAAGD